MSTLTPEQIAAHIGSGPWRLQEGALVRDLELPDFAGVIALVNRIADAAEALSAFDSRTPIEPFTSRDPGFDVRQAYAVAAAGHRLRLARGEKLVGAPGAFAFYVHHDGKTASLVQAKASADETVLKDVCMHVVAAVPRPQGLSASEVPAPVVEKERKFRIEQAMESGKPKEIAEKMVEGGMRKFFEEIALLEQPFVKDPTKKIKDIVGGADKLVAFRRWQVGE